MKLKLLKNQKKSQKQQEKSRGRSMVEMLGVLAIIGVLSIGGIAGYTIAMRRYRANEILNVANKYATLIWTSVNNEMGNGSEKYEWHGGSNPESYVYDYLPSDYIEKDNSNGYAICVRGPTHRCYAIYNYSFSNMGLGGLPSGVLEMIPGFISATKSGILVTIEVKFDSVELCNTIKSQFDYDPYVWGQSDTCAETQTFGIGFQQS